MYIKQGVLYEHLAVLKQHTSNVRVCFKFIQPRLSPLHWHTAKWGKVHTFVVYFILTFFPISNCNVLAMWLLPTTITSRHSAMEARSKMALTLSFLRYLPKVLYRM